MFSRPIKLFLLGLVFSLSATPSDSLLYPDDILAIKSRDTLVVAQFGGERDGFFAFDDENKLPELTHYNYNDRKLVGYDIELAQKIANELDVNLRIDRHFESFNSVAYAVAQGDADIAISKLSVTSERAQFLNYSTPYLSLQMAVLINRMNESQIGVDKANSLFACESENALIGVLDNSSFVDHGGKLFPNATLKMYADQQSLFSAVQNGDILAVLYEEYEIGKYMRKQPDLPIYCRTENIPGKSDDIAIAVAGNNVTLHGFIETFMKKENIAPTVQEIIQNYVPEEDLVITQAETKLNISDPALLTALLTSLVLILVWFSFSHNSRKSVKGNQ